MNYMVCRTFQIRFLLLIYIGLMKKNHFSALYCVVILKESYSVTLEQYEVYSGLFIGY